METYPASGSGRPGRPVGAGRRRLLGPPAGVGSVLGRTRRRQSRADRPRPLAGDSGRPRALGRDRRQPVRLRGPARQRGGAGAPDRLSRRSPGHRPAAPLGPGADGLLDQSVQRPDRAGGAGRLSGGVHPGDSRGLGAAGGTVGRRPCHRRRAGPDPRRHRAPDTAAHLEGPPDSLRRELRRLQLPASARAGLYRRQPGRVDGAGRGRLREPPARGRGPRRGVRGRLQHLLGRLVPRGLRRDRRRGHRTFPAVRGARAGRAVGGLRRHHGVRVRLASQRAPPPPYRRSPSPDRERCRPGSSGTAPRLR